MSKTPMECCIFHSYDEITKDWTSDFAFFMSLEDEFFRIYFSKTTPWIYLCQSFQQLENDKRFQVALDSSSRILFLSIQNPEKSLPLNSISTSNELVKGPIQIYCRYNYVEDRLELSFENMKESRDENAKVIEEGRMSITEDAKGRITALTILQASKQIVRNESNSIISVI